MDKTQIIIYIVFGVIYLLMRVMKNKRNDSAEHEIPTNIPQQRPQSAPRPKTQPISFEDLLKELAGVEEEEAPKPVRQAPVQQETYQHPFAGKQNQPVKQVIAEKTYNSPKGQFDKYKTKKAVSMEESYKSTPIKQRPDEFDAKYHAPEEVNELSRSVRNSLTNPEDVKQAIIMAEILKTKF